MSDNKQIMRRDAEDDFNALMVAQAMSKAGADVFSITDAGGPPFKPFTGRFIIWAKVKDDDHVRKVNECVEKEYADFERAMNEKPRLQ